MCRMCRIKLNFFGSWRMKDEGWKKRKNLEIWGKYKEETNHLQLDNPRDELKTKRTLTESLPWVRGFPGGSEDKESACDVGDPGSIPGLGRSSGEGNGNPLQYSCLKNPQGQRSLVGYSPQGGKELDTTERLHTQSGFLRLMFTIHFSFLIWWLNNSITFWDMN